MLRFAESHGCRMLHLLRHVGDEEDRTRPCGPAEPGHLREGRPDDHVPDRTLFALAEARPASEDTLMAV